MTDWGEERPATFGDCQGRPMPCPWVGCKYHALLDVVEVGSIVINSGMELIPGGSRRRQRPKQVSRRLPVWRQQERKKDDDRRCDEIVELLMASKNSCVLQMVENERTHTLEEVGSLLNVSRERVRQIEEKALDKAREDEGLTVFDCGDPS